MKERAEVIKISGKTAVVKIDRKSECSSCGMCGFKGKNNFVKLRAKNTADAKAGDIVIIEIENDNRLAASFIVYILPLIFVAAGLIAGYFTGSEIWMFIICLLMLAIGYIIIAAIDKKLSEKKGFCPEIVQIIQKEQ